VRVRDGGETKRFRFGAFPLRSMPASAHSHLGAFPLGAVSRLGRGADSARARRRRDEAVPLRPRLRGRKVLTALMSTGTQSTHHHP
jgi:hypothetical protein